MGKCHMGRAFYSIFCSVDLAIMNVIILSSIFLVLCVFTPGTFTAPIPGGGGLPFADLFLYNPLLGLGLGVAGGAVAKGVAGLAAAGAVAGKINTLANVANAKINLLNLGASIVEGGSSLLGGSGGSSTTERPSGQYYRPVYRYRYN